MAQQTLLKGNLDTKKLERIVKGYANSRRIQIMQLVMSTPEISLIDICTHLDIEQSNGSEHVRKLIYAGLVLKRKDLTQHYHMITDRGAMILSFLKTIK